MAPKKHPNAKPRVPIDEDKKPRRKRRDGVATHGQKRKEWEPTARQWAIYDAVRRGGSYRYVGQQFQMSHQAVAQTCDKIDEEYYAKLFIERVKRIRVRHTQYLEHIFSEAMSSWDQSRMGAPVLDQDGKETVERQQRPGEAVYLREAMRALASIRKIHAADKNPKLEDHGGDDTGERIAGKDREAVMLERASALTAAVNASRVAREMKEAITKEKA